MQTTSITFSSATRSARQHIKRVLRGRRDLRIVGEIGEAQALRPAERLTADLHSITNCAMYDVNALLVLPWLK
ncbi:MAG: hypothetical protein U0559_08040 [Anaerolineae bacterium]